MCNTNFFLFFLNFTQKPLLNLLKEYDVVGPEDAIVKCIPEAVLVENYVHLQMFLRK